MSVQQTAFSSPAALLLSSSKQKHWTVSQPDPCTSLLSVLFASILSFLTSSVYSQQSSQIVSCRPSTQNPPALTCHSKQTPKFESWSTRAAMIRSWLISSTLSPFMITWFPVLYYLNIYIYISWDFLGGMVDRNLPAPSAVIQVRSLVWEDLTCLRAARPTHHNYWSLMQHLLKPAHLEPVLRKKRNHNEKPKHHNKEQALLTTTRESPHAATKTQRSPPKPYFWLHLVLVAAQTRGMWDLSPQTRDWTCIPGTGKQILNHRPLGKFLFPVVYSALCFCQHTPILGLLSCFLCTLSRRYS